MQVVNTYEEYLNRKTLGEDVISEASVLGVSALQKTNEDFCVLTLASSTYCYYVYEVKDNKFHIADFRENVPHNLPEIIASGLLTNSKTQEWWNAVFHETASGIEYDDYYDTLRISDDADVTFGELIEQLKSGLHSLENLLLNRVLVLSGEYNISPIRYLCSAVLGAKEVQMIDSVAPSEINESQHVILPVDKMTTVVAVQGRPTLSTLSNSAVRLSFPMDPVTLESYVCNNITWKELIDSEAQHDYMANDCKFKYIDIHVECDAYGNLFLTCKDLLGNKKLKQL